MSNKPGSGREAGRSREFAVTDDLEFPLARTVEMPADVDYPTGALNFRLSSLVVALEGAPAAETISGEPRRYALKLPPLELRGNAR
ncbi:hypothetical protein F1721_18185 [Saccharopolyspora hirsuta]|uniref:Uncharacterized protein n=1 Tax=Saccharopolyspora hirsuta TaxID=1837 RepID=A0A5M7BPP3_SACHI|nr:hypothetical protein [Saccharopolyspora hirsuta]KAA5831772.1 hypothetical protein F1721_18185 [Saccharopolyspora hirsuta]